MKSLIDNDVNLGGAQTITGKKTITAEVDLQNNLKVKNIFFQGAPASYNVSLEQAVNAWRMKIGGSTKIEFGAQGVSYGGNGAITNGIIADRGRSLSANGYVKFNNGLIIQWGTTTQTNVTFPTPFTANNSYGLATGYGQSSESDHMYGCYYDATSTGFKITMYNSESSARWLAIGY